MEQVIQFESAKFPAQDFNLDSVLTDAVLSELKKQSINGCLLCFFDTWEEEE